MKRVKKIRKCLSEANTVHQTEAEVACQNKIHDLLMDDGEGHQYPEFANRFDDFRVVFDKTCGVAAVAWELGVIFINPDVLTPRTDIDSKKAEKQVNAQLSVLIRHEMAHNLLMHVVKTIRYFKKKFPNGVGAKLSTSISIHKLQNNITDFEISNKIYTPEDKQRVLHMMVGNKLVGGLVTEEHRDWATLDLEQMYDAFVDEIAALEASILNQSGFAPNTKDIIQGDYVEATGSYKDTGEADNFSGSVEDFINGKAYYHLIPATAATNRLAILDFDNLDEDGKNIVLSIYENLANSDAKKSDVQQVIEDLAKTGIWEKFDIVSPITGEVLASAVTPEEKAIASDTLKGIMDTLEPYNTWKAKITKQLGDSKFSKDDIQKILDSL